MSNLVGKNVLVTRPRPFPPAKDPLVELLTTKRAIPIIHPVVELSLIDDLDHATQILESLDQFATLVFVSANGACFFQKLIDHLEFPWPPQPSSLGYAAIGKGTASAMQKIGMRNVLVCPDSNSQGLATWLGENAEPPYLIVRADRGSQVLATELLNQQREFSEWEIYRSADVETAEPGVLEMFENGRLDWVTLTSSAIASSSVRLFGDHLANVKISTIGPGVSRVVRDAGLIVSAEASQSDFAGLVLAMEQVKS